MKDNVLPLYAYHATPECTAESHRGLWFDKFCDAWTISDAGVWSISASAQKSRKSKGEQDVPPKVRWLRDVTTPKCCGSSALLEEHVNRLIRFAEANRGAWRLVRTKGRFVTGMGRANPIENGFAWHHSLGVPYLPGSSLKGLTKSWDGEERLGLAEDELFGAGPGAGNGTRAGLVCFLDMIPPQPVPLAIDVMTPHYAGWSSQEPPGDWRAPVPVQFLTVTEGALYFLGVVPMAQADAALAERALAAALAALAEFGAGAKTSVGYGRMVYAKEETEQWRHMASERVEAERRDRERKAGLDDLALELLDIEAASQHKGERRYIAWLEAITRQNRWADDPAKRLEALKRIQVEMMRCGDWEGVPGARKSRKVYARMETVMSLIKELGG
jgi:CRISPR-associated protein Cmr6